MKNLSIFALLFVSASTFAGITSPIPPGEFSFQSLRQGVLQARSPEACDQLTVLQAMQACAAVRAADRGECETLVPRAARNLCFATLRSRTQDPCFATGESIGLRAKICTGVRRAEREKECSGLSFTAHKYCLGLLPSN